MSGKAFTGLSVGGSAHVNLVHSQVSGGFLDLDEDLYVFDEAQVSVADSEVSGGGEGFVVFGRAQVTLTNSQVSALIAFTLFDSSQVSLIDSQVPDGNITVLDSARLSLKNSWVRNGLGGGLDICSVIFEEACTAEVTVTDSQISGRSYTGLDICGSAFETSAHKECRPQVNISNSRISDHYSVGLVVSGKATVQIQNNVISDNRGCGILIASQEAQVRGSPNEMHGNGVDLCGFASASLRKPLVPQTDKTQLTVPADFQSLQEAVDAVAPGGTINIAEGSYETGLTLWKSVTMRGAGQKQTILKAGGPLVVSLLAEAQGVNIEGLTLQGGSEGLEILGQAALQDVQISENAYGLLVLGEAQVSLTHSQVSSNKKDGLLVGGSAQVSLTDSQVFDNDEGFLVSDSAQVSLSNAEISGNSTDGLLAQNSTQVSLTKTRVFGNKLFGLVVGDSARLTVTNSELSNNEPSSLLIGSSAAVEMKNNTVIYHSFCAVWVVTEQAQVRGTANEMRYNGADLCGFAPAAIRKPLVSQTDRTQLMVPGDYASLQEAIDAIAPGGTITVAAGSYETGLTVWKPLTIRGAGQDQTVLKALPNSSVVVSIIAEAQGIGIDGLMVTGSQGIGLFIYGRATLQNAKVSDNASDGLVVGGLAQVSLKNAKVSSHVEYGLLVGDSARLTLTNSELSANGFGLVVGDSAQANVFSSSLSANVGSGFVVRDKAKVEVQRSTIAGNGTDLQTCQYPFDPICNGILVRDQAQLTLSDVLIKDNADWGVTALLKPCGFIEPSFTGQVIFTGVNTIEGNNKLGNLNDKGNPGNHPFKNLPDGQVCLPSSEGEAQPLGFGSETVEWKPAADLAPGNRWQKLVKPEELGLTTIWSLLTPDGHTFASRALRQIATAPTMIHAESTQAGISPLREILYSQSHEAEVLSLESSALECWRFALAQSDNHHLNPSELFLKCHKAS